LIIGLTGGIATGKSTVARMLVERGALLVDADQIAREVVQPGSTLLAEIAHVFAVDEQLNILNSDGTLDRKKLGEYIFDHADAKQKLEALIHPAIRNQILSQMNALATQHPESLVIVDIPLLFESKYDRIFDQVIVVYVPREVQIQRLMERDGLSEEQAQQRIFAQMSIEEKRQLATVVIDNRADLAHTEQQIDQFLRSIQLHDQNH
jgi:dephospho-CoA kinase